MHRTKGPFGETIASNSSNLFGLKLKEINYRQLNWDASLDMIKRDEFSESSGDVGVFLRELVGPSNIFREGF